MSKLPRHDLIGALNSMLVYAFKAIDKWEGHEESKLDEKVKENLRQAHQQIKDLIQNQPEVDEEFVEDWILRLSDWRERKVKFSCLQIILQILIEAGIKVKED